MVFFINLQINLQLPTRKLLTYLNYDLLHSLLINSGHFSSRFVYNMIDIHP